jgi:starch-binding outer membrane protein, SusD/RagB family
MNRRTMARAGAAACLLLAATACTDLTVAPKSTISSAQVFTSDPNSYRAYLAKLYAGLAVSGQQGGAGQPDLDPSFDEGFSQYIRLWWQMNELPTDEAIIAWNDGSLSELNSGAWGSSNAFLGAMYNRITFQITQANEFLRQSTDAVLASRGVTNTAVIHTYRAEARFLRALSYWHAIDLFGNYILVTENDPVGGPPAAHASRQQMYDFVVGELTDILNQGDLPPAGVASSYGRATDMAAQMLLAKVYLNAGVYTGTTHYTEAMTAVNAVIGSGTYSLAPVYLNNFKADNNTSPELIFAVTSDGNHSQSYGSTNFLIHASCGGSMSSAALGIDGCWWGLRLKPEAYAFYTAGDARGAYLYTSGQTVAVTDMYTFTNGIAAPKYQNVTSGGAPGSRQNFVDTDFPMFRLGDAYLMYVELFLRNGGGTQALAAQYFNDLRQRAYGATAPDTIATASFVAGSAAMLDTVLAERGRELLWEGHRRTDLVRFGKFTGSSYIWAWKGGVLGGQATSANIALYPLPAAEMVANPNLCQNPGYGGTPCP